MVADNGEICVDLRSLVGPCAGEAGVYVRMSDAVSFTLATAGLPFYWALTEGQAVPAAGSYAAGFFQTSSNISNAPVSLEDSWNGMRGIYLFLGNIPGNDGIADLVSRLQAYSAVNPDAKFAWIADCAAPVLNGPCLNKQTGTSGVFTYNDLRFHNYSFSTGNGTRCTIRSQGDGFTFSDGSNVTFQMKRFPTMGTDVQSVCVVMESGGLTLPMGGEDAGVISCFLPGDDFYTTLDMGLRYTVPIESGSYSVRYPLMYGMVGNMKMAVRIDVNRPLDPERTSLLYVDATAQTSYLRSPYGAAFTLAPSFDVSYSPAGYVLQPCRLSDDDASLYFAPTGAFQVVEPAGEASMVNGVMAGLSSQEFFRPDMASGLVLQFHPSQPAYVVTSDDGPQRSDIAQTSWVTVHAVAGAKVSYFSQPIVGSMFLPTEVSSVMAPVDLLLIDSVTLDEPFPLTPYAGISATDADVARQLERGALGPWRQTLLAEDVGAPAQQAPLAETQDEASRDEGSSSLQTRSVVTLQTSVTAQGMVGTFKSDYSQWTQLTMAGPLPAPYDASHPPPLALNNLGGDLRQALQSSQMFTVLADVNRVMAAADFNYWITDDVLKDLAALPVGTAPTASVLTKLNTLRVPKVGKAAFISYLKSNGVNASDGANTQASTDLRELIASYSVYFELSAAGWRFRLSPALWRLNPDHNTIMIMKFATGTLRDLARSTSQWAWKKGGQAPDGTQDTTRNRVLSIIDSAIAEVASNGTSSPLSFFVNTVCNDPTWMGIVFLDAQTPLVSMPVEMQGLGNGITPSSFRAHHVGFSVASAIHNSAGLTVQAPAVFGLIDYAAPSEITYCDGDFAFQVSKLQILIANSAVVRFTNQIALYVNRLFGETVTLSNSAHYNNLLLNGVYQRQGSGGHYIYTAPVTNNFVTNSPVLQKVAVKSAQFTTISGASANDLTIRGRFTLDGTISFYPQRGFDVFSYGPQYNDAGVMTTSGYAKFSGLVIDMTATAGQPQTAQFNVDVSSITFNQGKSVPRLTSLAARFPLTLSGMVHGAEGTMPQDLGYAPVKTPLQQPVLGEWYGLVYSLNLGGLGSLASQAGVTVKLLAAWEPGTEARINVGLQLPGAQAMKSLPAIEGVLGAGFQSLEFEADGALLSPPNPSYVLRMQHFYLSLLGWKLPPGQADMYLFGDPAPAAQASKALGWYTAWGKGN